MAKKKSAKKPAPKPSKKPAAKPVKKAPSAKPAAPAKPSAAPAGGPVSPINTGSGASPAEVGAKLVQMFNDRVGDDKIWNQLFAKDFVSIEGHGVNMLFRGRKAVEAKADEWMKSHVVHGSRAEGPFVGSTGFAVRITIDVEEKATGKRRTMDEIGVYTVQDGKVIQEEFMYGG